MITKDIDERLPLPVEFWHKVTVRVDFIYRNSSDLGNSVVLEPARYMVFHVSELPLSLLQNEWCFSAHIVMWCADLADSRLHLMFLNR